MSKVLAELADRTGAKLHDGSREGKILDRLDHAVAALLEASSIAESACEPVPPRGTNNIDENWLALTLREIQEFNSNGVDYINSCSEALIKSHGIMNWWFEDPGARRKIYYRGECNYGWNLIPRVSRGGCKHDTSSPLSVTECELNYLSEFQEKVRADSDFSKSIFGDNETPDDSDPSWWAIMQHYDSGHGTRMIDVTSSLFCGLFFACASWEGKVDESIDGAFYLITGSPWRTETKHPDIIRGQVVGPEDPWKETVKTYFEVPNHVDTLRFRESRHRNDRLIAQDGFFLWQPKFDEPLNIGQHFKFRVYRGAKKHILRELYSTGYTARRIVRGQLGNEAHIRLCSTLEVEAG